MAAKKGSRQDPWNDLASRKGNQQVGLEEVLPNLAVASHTAQALKKALVKRVTKITRTR